MLLMGFIVSIHLLWWGSGLMSGNPEEGSQTSIERSIFDKNPMSPESQSVWGTEATDIVAMTQPF